MKKNVILIGAGGHSDNIRFVIGDKYNVVGYLDDWKVGEYHGLPILGKKLEDVEDYEKYAYFVSIGDLYDRRAKYDMLKSKNLEVINVIDESVRISEGTVIGDGNYIAPFTAIMADVVIGDDNYIGTGAVIEHGSRIGSHCRITANSNLNGEMIVEDEVYFGSSAVCNGGSVLGEKSIVGSGAVVLGDIPKGVTVVGIPARVIKKRYKEKIVIIGAGQQGRNCRRLAEELLYDVVAFVDDFETSDYVEGVKVYKKIEDVDSFKELKYIVAIGDISVRRRYIGEIERMNLEPVNLIDPTAIIERGAKIGVGNYIYKNVVVYKSATIGDHNIVNSCSVLATDCVIGDNCDIRFGAKICGDCHVGNDSVVGYNAAISSGYNVGEHVVVEANSVVYRDVADGEYVEGVVK